MYRACGLFRFKNDRQKLKHNAKAEKNNEKPVYSCSMLLVQIHKDGILWLHVFIEMNGEGGEQDKEK